MKSWIHKFFGKKSFASELSSAMEKPVGDDVKFALIGTRLIAKCPHCGHRQETSVERGHRILCDRCAGQFEVTELKPS